MSVKLLLSAVLSLLVLVVQGGGPAISTNPNGQHSMFLCSDGTVWTWGRNTYGQLGDNSTVNRSTPVQVRGPGGSGFLINIISVSAGAWFSTALRNDGTVWTWGYNGYGQLGNNTTVSSLTPVQVTGPGGSGFLTNITAVQACGHYALALRNDGTVWSWGLNNSGRLGDNTTITRLAPVQVLGPGGSGFLANITALGAGGGMSMTLRNDGTVWSWGFNSSGQLGNNSTVTSLVPVQVKDGTGGSAYLTNVISIASGDVHGMAIKNDGTLWTWGNNGNGRLGDGTITNRLYATQVVGPGGSGNLTNVIWASGGYAHSLAVRSDGSVWSWGSNIRGQLGINSTTGSYTPVQVLGVGGSGTLANIVSVASGGQTGGWDHAMALRNDGVVYSWGANNYNQVGDGSATDRWTPVLTTASWGGSCGALPVELVYFDARMIEGNVSLEWETASESGSSHFTIERSRDGKNFEAVAAVSGSGYTAVPVRYSYSDNISLITNCQLLTAIYYRLRQVDMDGKSILSQTVAVKYNASPVRWQASLLPGGVLSLSVNLQSVMSVTVSACDLTGKEVFSEKLGTLPSGNHKLRLVAPGITQGLYFLKLTAGGTEYLERLSVLD